MAKKLGVEGEQVELGDRLTPADLPRFHDTIRAMLAAYRRTLEKTIPVQAAVLLPSCSRSGPCSICASM